MLEKNMPDEATKKPRVLTEAEIQKDLLEDLDLERTEGPGWFLPR